LQRYQYLEVGYFSLRLRSASPSRVSPEVRSQFEAGTPTNPIYTRLQGLCGSRETTRTAPRTLRRPGRVSAGHEGNSWLTAELARRENAALQRQDADRLQ